MIAVQSSETFPFICIPIPNLQGHFLKFLKKKLVERKAIDDSDSISVKEYDSPKKVVVVQVLPFKLYLCMEASYSEILGVTNNVLITSVFFPSSLTVLLQITDDRTKARKYTFGQN